MKRNMLTATTFGLAVLFVLPGCNFTEWMKSFTADKDSVPVSTQASAMKGDIIVHINGEPALTSQDFTKYLQQVMQSNPYFKSIGVDALPGQIKKKVFDRVVEQRLVVAKAKQSGLDQSAEFKATLAETMKSLETALLVQQYEKQLLNDISVTADAVREEYDKNKPRYIKVAGGSQVDGIRFDDQGAANEFYELVKKDLAAFSQRAQENEKGEFKEFGRVSQDPRSMVGTSIPAALRKQALEMEGKEESKVIEVDDSHWVLRVHDTKETVYFEFDEIKDQLENMVKMQKFKERLDANLEKLRAEFTIDIDNDFLKQFEESGPFQTYTDKDGTKVTRVPVEHLPIKKIDPEQAHEVQDASSVSA